MEFLRELYTLVAPGSDTKKKKKTKAGTLLPLGGFVAGFGHHQHDYDDDDKDDGDTSDVGAGGMDGGGVGESAKLVVPVAKPRNKQLHDTLSGRKGGRMADKKADYKRKDKHPKKGMFESQTWEYEIGYEVKDNAGGGEDRIEHTTGTVKADSAADAKAKAKAQNSRRTIVSCTVTPE